MTNEADTVALQEVVTVTSAPKLYPSLAVTTVNRPSSATISPTMESEISSKIKMHWNVANIPLMFDHRYSVHSKPFEIMVGSIKTKWNVGIMRKQPGKVGMFLFKRSETSSHYKIRAEFTLLKNQSVVIESRTIGPTKAGLWQHGRGFDDFILKGVTNGIHSSRFSLQVKVELSANEEHGEIFFHQSAPSRVSIILRAMVEATAKGICLSLVIIFFLELFFLGMKKHRNLDEYRSFNETTATPSMMSLPVNLAGNDSLPSTF